MSDQEHGAIAPSAPAKLAGALSLVPKPTGSGPAHAYDPRRDEETKRGTNVSVPREELFDILTGLKKLAPCHKEPHAYHERKDELVARLHHLATAS